MRLVDENDLVGEVDAECFACGLLQEEIVREEDELRWACLVSALSPEGNGEGEEGDGEIHTCAWGMARREPKYGQVSAAWPMLKRSSMSFGVALITPVNTTMTRTARSTSMEIGTYQDLVSQV